MQIKNFSEISFGQLKFKRVKDDENKRFVFEDFVCKDRYDNDCFVKSEGNFLDNFRETVKIYDNKNNPLAENELHYYKAIQQIYNSDMKTLEGINYKKGYGTIMHLCSIMELLENNYPLIKLSSLSKAIYFHSKMKFEPAIDNLKELTSHLQGEVIDNSPEKLEYFSEKAKRLLADKSIDEEAFLKKGNQILADYIQAIRKGKFNREEHKFLEGFTMILTKENILKNKDFFNKLLKDFRIDYLIK